jgi:hypothetical protein
VVKMWVENYWYDFEGLDARQLRLTQFLTDKLATDPHFTKPAHKLLYTISRKVPCAHVPKISALMIRMADLHAGGISLDRQRGRNWPWCPWARCPSRSGRRSC